MKKQAKLLNVFSFVVLAATVLPATGQSPTVDTGKFRLHKFEQPVGEETYTITQDKGSVSASMNFKFTDRGTEVPLTATFRAAPDLTPQSFAIKGKTSRQSVIDEGVEAGAGKVRVRNRDQWTEAAASEKFFTIAGYAPTTMQMLLVRYWATHGSPDELAIFPSGRVRIHSRGTDTFTINGKTEKLNRYTIEGLIWGRETLWFDSHWNLVAAVTLDAEFDHFEAICEGYESALPDFVFHAGADGMAALADISKGISGSHAETLALVGATLVDGTGKPAISNSAVVIERGRITAVGPRAEVKIPANATVLDETGRTIMPGLWDMHAHFEQVEWGPIYLAAGVTTVRDVGNELEFIEAVRDAVASGRGLGPRLLLAGVVDGSGNFAIGMQRVNTPEQARQWVDRYHEAGFQQIKIYSSVQLEELKAVAQEAHRLGMTVTGHIPEGLNAFQAVEAGQDQINHIQYIADIMRRPLPADATRIQKREAAANTDLNSPEAQKALSFLKAHGTVVDPTMALFEFFTATTAKPVASFEPGVTKVAPELAEQLTGAEPPSEKSELMQRMFDKYLAIVSAMHRAGIPIVAGTDQAVPGHSLHREIELYVQAGFTPMEAIQAATLVPARVMGLDKEVGTVEGGKRADLIILNGNPLDDIHNTRNVEYVITNGVMYNCGELWKSVGFKP